MQIAQQAAKNQEHELQHHEEVLPRGAFFPLLIRNFLRRVVNEIISRISCENDFYRLLCLCLCDVSLEKC
jgi:hypothetical protein